MGDEYVVLYDYGRSCWTPQSEHFIYYLQRERESLAVYGPLVIPRQDIESMAGTAPAISPPVYTAAHHRAIFMDPNSAHPCFRSGGCRMWTCSCNEPVRDRCDMCGEIETDGAVAGSGERTVIQARIPLASGGWLGSFCSWDCAAEWCVDMGIDDSELALSLRDVEGIYTAPHYLECPTMTCITQVPLMDPDTGAALGRLVNEVCHRNPAYVDANYQELRVVPHRQVCRVIGGAVVWFCHLAKAFKLNVTTCLDDQVSIVIEAAILATDGTPWVLVRALKPERGDPGSAIDIINRLISKTPGSSDDSTLRLANAARVALSGRPTHPAILHALVRYIVLPDVAARVAADFPMVVRALAQIATSPGEKSTRVLAFVAGARLIERTPEVRLRDTLEPMLQNITKYSAAFDARDAAVEWLNDIEFPKMDESTIARATRWAAELIRGLVA